MVRKAGLPPLLLLTTRLKGLDERSGGQNIGVCALDVCETILHSCRSNSFGAGFTLCTSLITCRCLDSLLARRCGFLRSTRTRSGGTLGGSAAGLTRECLFGSRTVSFAFQRARSCP